MHDDTSASDDLILVPLWETESSHRTRYGNEVDLRADRLDKATVSALRDAALTLAVDEEISEETLRDLRNRLTVPTSFEESGWLSGHRVLPMHSDDRASVGSLIFALHPVFGLELVDPVTG